MSCLSFRFFSYRSLKLFRCIVEPVSENKIEQVLNHFLFADKSSTFRENLFFFRENLLLQKSEMKARVFFLEKITVRVRVYTLF
jgi:hypothetical protein